MAFVPIPIQSGRRRNCDAGVAIAMPASIFGYCNCDARKYFNFLKFEIFVQNHLIFLEKLKRPKKLSYRKEQNLVLWEFFLCSFHLKKNKFVFCLNFRGLHNCDADQTVTYFLKTKEKQKLPFLAN